MKSVTILLAAGFAATASAATGTNMGVEQPSSSPIYKQPVVQGCFSSAGDLVFNSNQTFNSRGECGQTICQAKGFTVAASSEGEQCYCGNSYPPKSSLVDDSNCNAPCTGYGVDACGGSGYFTVYNTGLKLTGIPFADDKDTTSSSSSSSSSSTVTPSTKASPVATTIVGGQTVFVTQTSEAKPSPKKSGGSNTAGIAGGVVAGVVVIAAVVGGIFLVMRRRRNREIEEEHRRNAAVNAFFSGASKTPSTNGEFTAADARLDPVMAQRRMSDGSIADNEDYSRRILRVTNA